MKSKFISLVFGLATIVAASPLHNQLSGLSKRALTPDNTCGLVANGNNKGYTCDPNLAQGGPCCSASGYCGSAAAYCGDGCQAAYGTCGVSSSSSSAAPSSTSSGSTPVGTSTDTCGANNGGLVCAAGYCCSPAGYCGKTADYCSNGCQASYGSCGTTPGSSTSSANTPGPTGSTDTCGPSNGNAVCATGLCCSPEGYCGKTADYCTTGCQPAYGSCNTTTGPSSTASAGGPGPTGSTDLCGPTNGNAICAKGLCCSPGGYCGTGADYCGDPTCQYNYGTCDSDTTPNGTSTINDPRPALGSVTYTDDIYDCVQANVVALTFDDGPLYYTNQLLDILKQYNFKATFFITGNNIHKGAIDVTAPYPDVIKRMYTEGHQIASHTWSHYDLSNLTSPQRIQQMVKNERAIANIVGKYPTYMRPPYSSCNEDSGCWADMQALGYHRTYFDLDTQDYLNQSPDLVQNSKDIVKWALGNATYGSDFLSIQHDIGQQSVTNLSSYYFDLIQKKGWRGVTVGECLGDPVENWYRTPGTGQGGPISSVTTSSIKPTTTASIKPTTTPTVKPTTTASVKTTTTASTKTTTTSTTPSVKPTTTPSVKPTTTASTKSTTASTTPATTKIQTATTPVATAQCDQPPSGTFCGKVRSFDSRNGCTVAYYDCKQQQRDCSGKGTKEACLKWGGECAKLDKYCRHCGKHCSDKGFRASGE